MLATGQRPPPVLGRQNNAPLSSTISYSPKMAPSQTQRTSALKRKRLPPTTSYRSETQIDSTTGRIREVILIDDDTPSPPPTAPMSITPSTHSASIAATYSNGVRTRAQVAAEASGSRVVPAPPAAKRRKKEAVPVPSGSGNGLRAHPSSAGGALQRKAIASRAYDQKVPVGYANGDGTASSVREVRALASASHTAAI